VAFMVARFASSGVFPCRDTYAAAVCKQEVFHHRIVDDYQTIRNHPGIFERMRRSIMRRIEACIESHGR
jgi:hypothetical protein